MNTRNINFFQAVSDIIFQYSFFHAVSDIIKKKSIRLLTGSEYQEHTNPLSYRAKCLKLKDI